MLAIIETLKEYLKMSSREKMRTSAGTTEARMKEKE